MVGQHEATPAAHPHLAPASKHQLFYFDAVRGLSAQMVLVGHSLNLFVPTAFMVAAGGRWRPRDGVLYMQNLGVLLFFVLSGFLVSRSALTKMKSDQYTFGEYFLERFARIFVPFVPAVLLVSVLDRLVLQGRPNPFTTVPLDLWTTVTNLTMLYNNPVLEKLGALTGLPLGTDPIGTADPFWSVVIEFWIYITFGLVLLRIVRDRRIGVLGVLALLFSAVVVAATVVGHHGLVLAWVVGMLYAVGRPGSLFASRGLHKVLGVAGLVLTPLCLWRTHWDVYDELVALCLSVAVMSLYAGFGRPVPVAGADRSRLPGPVLSVVKYVSDYSYSLYLVHFSLLVYLQTVPGVRARPVAAILGAVVAANLLALAYWFLIERHYPQVRRAIRRGRVWQALDPGRREPAGAVRE